MPNLDRQQLVGALMLLVMALFVGRNLVNEPYRKSMQKVLVALYLLAVAIILVWVAQWLFGL